VHSKSLLIIIIIIIIINSTSPTDGNRTQNAQTAKAKQQK